MKKKKKKKKKKKIVNTKRDAKGNGSPCLNREIERLVQIREMIIDRKIRT